MPARLLILDDASAATIDRWVDRPFLTIGTDSGSDVPLAGGDAEVRIYLQFRDGRYEVFNKQADDVRLGGRLVPVGSSSPWEPGAELEVGRQRLRLMVDGDPAPGARPLAAAPRPVREPNRGAIQPGPATSLPAARQPTAPPEDRSRTIKLGVIFACLAASTLLLLRDRILPPSSAAASDPEDVTALMKEAFPTTSAAPEEPAAALRRRLARRLQWAETAWLQRDYAVAAERYESLKQYLDGSRLATAAGDSPATDDWQSRLASHVDSRTADLARQ